MLIILINLFLGLLHCMVSTDIISFTTVGQWTLLSSYVIIITIITNNSRHADGMNVWNSQWKEPRSHQVIIRLNPALSECMHVFIIVSNPSNDTPQTDSSDRNYQSHEQLLAAVE